MKRTLLAASTGAVILVGAALALTGNTMVAAQRQRATVIVKPTGIGRKSTGMVVALKQRGPTQGTLQMLNKQGQPAGDCPLKHTDVKADVAGMIARVDVTQEFHNPSTEPIEAVYTFPLPDDAAVDDMEMRIGTRIVKGEIKRREEAREVYEAAKAAGQTAALLDQERPNIFTQAVANIMPGQDITIHISYVNTLKYDEGQYEFSFPMVVGPRYTPTGGYTTPGKRGDPSATADVPADPGATSVVTDADKITPPITPPGTRAGHDISMTVNIDAGMPLGPIASVLHEIAVQPNGNRATVTLRNQGEIPNKDFILRWSTGNKGVQPGILCHADAAGDGYFTLILQPPAAPPAGQVSPKEMVFVIDQTGSQMGWPIEKAKETMKYAISKLNPGDTFQLIGFNTDVYPCFPGAVPASAANIQKAQAYLGKLEGAGGTDILKAADYALKMPVDRGRLRIICFMTDGYVGNDMQIIGFVKNNRGQARMFPFGVGNGVNRFLIDGMASEGRGQADYVTLEEDGQDAAEKFYRRISSPLLLDPQVDWNGLPVEDVFPRQIPDVFTSGPIVLRGRYTREAEGNITVRGLLRGKPWSQSVHVKLPAVRPEASAISSLWARAKIDDIQANDWIGAQTGKPNPNVKEDIVRVALAHRLMSQYTSFVAVEKQIVNVGGRQRTVDVPVEMPEGVAYDGIFGKEELASRALSRASGAVGGGFGGTYYSTAPAAPAALPALKAMPRGAPTPAVRLRAGVAAVDSLSLDASVAQEAPVTAEIAKGTELGQKALKDMKPEDRPAALRSAKLAPVLLTLADTVKKDGVGGSLHKKGLPDVEKGRVVVQVALNTLPKDGLAKLKAAGFELTATLTKDRLLLGSIDLKDLDALIALDFVRRVQPATLS